MLLDPITIKGLEIPNCIVRSATCDWMSDGGAVVDGQVELYAELSRGDIGLIVSGHMYVREDGDASPGMYGIEKDERVEGLRRLVAAVHENGPSKVVAQLNHGGRNATMRYDKGDVAGPSAIATKEGAPVPRAFDTKEVFELAAAYGDAAGRAKAAGFDGVQIHGAHGYLVSQFLSPLSNTRDDEFGGSLENRARFLRLIVAEIRERVGREYAVLIKLGTFDGAAGGLTLEEGTRVGAWLEEWGVDAIEVSGGIGAGNSDRGVKAGENEAQFLEQARPMKRAVGVPVISVNGYRSLDVMEKVLSDGDADMIAMCRPFIREPGLVRDFESGASSVAACVSCNGCFGTRDNRLRCVRA